MQTQHYYNQRAINHPKAKNTARASLIDSKAILWKATGTTDPDVPSKPGKLKLAKMGKWNSFSPRDHKRSPATSTAAEEPPSIKKSKYPKIQNHKILASSKIKNLTII